MELFVQQLANGIMVGGIYGLMALGLTLIYGVLYIPNFALGHQAMIAAYLTFFLVSLYNVNYFVAVAIAMVALAALGMVLERFAFRPLRNAPHVNGFIVAFGLLFVLESGALIAWGATYRKIDTVYEREILTILGARLPLQRVLVVVAVVVVIVAMQLFLKRTMAGAALRAVSQERDAAQLVGIDVDRVAALTMAVGSALGAAAGGLIGPIILVFPTMGNLMVVKAFVIIVLGGMGSVVGAIVGGFLLGLVESFAAGYISPSFKDLYAFLFLVIVLAVRPTGLF
ncbi:MAG: branched-chain amino acid ABC transporter permease, partial [Candidatus Rokubacteria bacterium]|nr:branched-chain amino acid ABC transporter permease [Candidatus Rokubacteria bacterium]